MILDHRLSMKKTSPAAEPHRAASTSGSASMVETDKPPPYTRDIQAGPTGASGSISGRRLPPALPPLPRDQPLPFSNASLPYTPPGSRFPEPPKISKQSPLPDPPPTVNQVHLHSKHEDIIGTFYVDPQIPALTPGGKKRKRDKRRPDQPHASFHTRSGGMSLSLGTTGNAERTPKATVMATSRTGNIEIRLLPSPLSRPRIGLDVTSRSGEIMVWLPETFSGVIQANTGKGELHVLPGLGRMVRVLKSTDKEVMLLMGSQQISGGENSAMTDLCQLSSRSGKVIIGLSGQDKLPEQSGFWKKVTNFFKG